MPQNAGYAGADGQQIITMWELYGCGMGSPNSAVAAELGLPLHGQAFSSDDVEAETRLGEALEIALAHEDALLRAEVQRRAGNVAPLDRISTFNLPETFNDVPEPAGAAPAQPDLIHTEPGC